ncbi:MAG: hemolysin family protein, partial [Planctomycetota bacterium]|nr:hemolysin family protein [Planctomycetota bacterium]
IADHAGHVVVHRCAGLVRLLFFLTWPFARALAFIDLVIKRLAGVEDLTDEEELERELMSVVSEGEEEGALDENERQMIEAVVEFRSTTVDQIMTPRTEVEGFELTNDLNYIRAFIEEAGHSRIPVYEGDLDHIAGVLYAKDLLRFLGRDVNGFDLRSILRRPTFVPETKPLRGLLQEFQQNKVHLAIVLDEYGGTAGLVTIEDVLEEIVGEIEDEYEPATETPPSIQLVEGQRSVICDARAYIDDVNDELEAIDASLPEGESYDTVGGFVLSILGHMPVAGESFTLNGFIVKVLEAEPTRVTRVQIDFREKGHEPEPTPEPQPAAPEASQDK